MAGKQAQGSKFQIGIGSPVVYSSVEAVNSITGPQGTVSQIEVTDLDSLAVERIAGVPDNGTCQLNVNLTYGAVQTYLRAAFDEREDAIPMRLLHPIAPGSNTYKVWSFNGIVTGFTPTTTSKDKLTAQIDISVDGEVVITQETI